MSDFDYMPIEIGHAGGLTRQALRQVVRDVQKVLSRISPMTALDIAIGGYDDDPREIWDIPEARRFVIGFAAGMLEAGISLDRFLPAAVGVICACLAAEEGRSVVVTDKPEIDITDQIAEHQTRVRRKMQ